MGGAGRASCDDAVPARLGTSEPHRADAMRALACDTPGARCGNSTWRWRPPCPVQRGRGRAAPSAGEQPRQRASSPANGASDAVNERATPGTGERRRRRQSAWSAGRCRCGRPRVRRRSAGRMVRVRRRAAGGTLVVGACCACPPCAPGADCTSAAASGCAGTPVALSAPMRPGGYRPHRTRRTAFGSGWFSWRWGGGGRWRRGWWRSSGPGRSRSRGSGWRRCGSTRRRRGCGRGGAGRCSG